MSKTDLRAEIEALHREIAAIRAEHAKGDVTKADEPRTLSDTDPKTVTDQLQLLAREISAFAEDPEKIVLKHPLASILGALVLGMLIGRVTR